jgi:hypothetical protein
MVAVPPVVVGLALGLSLTYKIIERRQKLAGDDSSKKEVSNERR